MSRHAQPMNRTANKVTRRALLGGAGVIALAGAASAGESQDAAPKRAAGERYFEGESKSGNFQEALDQALAQLDKVLNEGGVADASANWKLVDVNGQRGTIAALRTVKVKILATRVPPWDK